MAEEEPTPLDALLADIARNPATCWKCGSDRYAYGDGSRHCTHCGAGELGWVKL